MDSTSHSAQSFRENRLSKERSPYLLQHKNNPVDWYPWGEEALARSHNENKPIFLSIGYSTCHWCHVMAHESFEDPEIANIMNEYFVNIKVDREERPDIDKIYMTYVQAVSGGGGWPMSVWLTPQLTPIVGGTYFPPRDSYGRPGFPLILKHVAQRWASDQKKLLEEGERVMEIIKESIEDKARLTNQKDSEFSVAALEPAISKCFEQIKRGYDPVFGGFTEAPKFPRPVIFNLLFRVVSRDGKDSPSGKSALEMCLFTLKKMGEGGMFDHIGGGFHRYSVTHDWHIPHFEKMLYDQGQLLISYLEAFQISQESFYAEKARAIADYVSSQLTSPEGGFYCAEDADSLLEHGKPDHAEGAFYLWKYSELQSILGEETSNVFSYHFGVEKEGNAPPESDPHGDFKGKNILMQRHSVQDTANKFGLSIEKTTELLANCKQKLLVERNLRPRPHLDDKIIVAWNGLMIAGFVRAHQTLGEEKYLTTAINAANFIRKNLYSSEKGILMRSYREGLSKIEGFTDDYAFFIHGLIDLYEASADIEWLKWAVQLQNKQRELFWDRENGGFFAVREGDKNLLLRMKEDYDGAEPCNNSVSALNLLRLSAMLSSIEFQQLASRIFQTFANSLRQSPIVLPQMCVALDFFLRLPKQIIVAFDEHSANRKQMLREIHKYFIPNKIILHADQKTGQAFLSQYLKELKDMHPIDEKTTVFICENFTCKLPIFTLDALQEILIQLSRKYVN